MNDENFDVKEALEKAKDYINTYDSQDGWESCSAGVWKDDMLYLIGISISDEYQFARGFRRFKQDLLRELED